MRSRDSRQQCRAIPLEDPEHVADVVSTSIELMSAPWAVAQFAFPPDATRAQIRAVAGSVAVFELEPTDIGR